MTAFLAQLASLPVGFASRTPGEVLRLLNLESGPKNEDAHIAFGTFQLVFFDVIFVEMSFFLTRFVRQFYFGVHHLI